MPRRERLSPVQRAALVDIPTDRDGLSRYYMLNAQDRSLIAERRGDHNRLGVAVQLAYLRHPGMALNPDTEPPAVYIDRAIKALRDQGRPFDDAWLQHIAPVHWNHINLTGDYSWRQNKRVEKRRLRPLRMRTP